LKWRFEPALEDGRPVAGAYEGRIAFTLDLPRHSARMFARPSAEVWGAVKGLLADLKLKTDRKDDRAQVLSTRSATLSSAWNVPELDLGPRLAPTGVQFQVFVSPFVEPARVHLASELDAVDRLDSRAGRRLYDVVALQSWFLDRLEEKVGIKSQAMPSGRARRIAVARELLGSRPADPCLGAVHVSGGRISPPKEIAGFKKQPLYPEDARRERTRGVVDVEASLLEDGALVPRGFGGPRDPDASLVTSAIQAARFWVYEPARSNGCPIDILFTATVRFRLD
jgi:TonB family protein